MTERLQQIFSSIPNATVFADIGCDHGYIAKAMLESGKCEKVIVSDISEKCLNKARELLSENIANGSAESVVSDGFDRVFGVDVALIAGMGGEEICNILQKAQKLPEKLVLQPMKNPEKVRTLCLKLGFLIEKDSLFKSAGKFYDLIVAKKGQGTLTEEEIEFGKDNVNNPNEDFKEKLTIEINKINNYLGAENISDKTKQELTARLEKYKKYV